MLNNQILEIHEFFIKKRKRSNGIFIALNIIAMFIAAGLVVLNLYAIRKNPAKDDTTIMIMFVLTSILSGASGVITALMSFFVFRKKALKAKDKAESISHERNLWKNKKDRYSDSDRDQIIIDRVLKIIEE